MTTGGWIKLFKDIKYEEGLQTLMLRHIYIACLLDANYKEKKHKGEKIKLGEFTTSYAAFAKRHFITKSGAEKGLKRLEKEGKIGLESTSQRTKITVIKYEDRQSRRRSGDDYGDDSETIRRTTKKKEETNKKKEGITQKNNICDIFEEPELNNWVGPLAKKRKDKWLSLMKPSEIAEIAHEAKMWQGEKGKKYKSIASFLNNWLKKEKIYQERLLELKRYETLSKYEK